MELSRRFLNFFLYFFSFFAILSGKVREKPRPSLSVRKYAPERKAHAMKTRTWILLIIALVLVLSGLSFILLKPGQASLSAEIYSEGQLVRTVSLLQEQTFTVTSSKGGTNTMEVKGGKIAVVDADCPDHHCMNRGFCNNGPSIICLPNALEIRFLGPSPVDMPLG